MLLQELVGDGQLVLTDGGTSALVMALRAAAGSGVAALPAYGCFDLVSAAEKAGVRVRFYDLDPHTLSPDLDSLSAAIVDGVSTVVVAHLYGLPADTASVRKMAARHGCAVIEDTAQGLGAWLQGKRAGTFGDLTVLSFGRGKGTTSGRGGALINRSTTLEPPSELKAGNFDHADRGWKDVALISAMWVCGRPSVYGLPASIPSLKLGEMVYRPAHEAAPLSYAAMAMLRDALTIMDTHTHIRRQHALLIRAAIGDSGDIVPCESLPEGIASFHRFPVIARVSRREVPEFGIVRGYPHALFDCEQGEALRAGPARPMPGASELQRSLFTLPTHHMVTGRDIDAIGAWVHGR
jgi:perosamine synthetase